MGIPSNDLRACAISLEMMGSAIEVLLAQATEKFYFTQRIE